MFFLVYHPHNVIKIDFESFLIDHSLDLTLNRIKEKISEISTIPCERIELSFPIFFMSTSMTVKQMIMSGKEKVFKEKQLETLLYTVQRTQGDPSMVLFARFADPEDSSIWRKNVFFFNMHVLIHTGPNDIFIRFGKKYAQ